MRSHDVVCAGKRETPDFSRGPETADRRIVLRAMRALQSLANVPGQLQIELKFRDI